MRVWLPALTLLSLALTGCPALLSDWTVSGSGAVDASVDATGPEAAGGRSGSGSGGSGASSGLSGGASSGGSAGSDGSHSDGGVSGGDAAPQCPPLTFRSGSICIDNRPALLGDGTQGPALDFRGAVAACAARGARVCTESERETSCPDAGANFCDGPANTWEWSLGDICPVNERRRSPCCTVSQGFGECVSEPGEPASYRCCFGGNGGGPQVTCLSDLSGVGAGDFSIHFTLTTTESVLTLGLLNQRTGCDDTSTFWDISLSSTGGIVAVTNDGTHRVFVEAGNGLNDGKPHKVDVIRRGGKLWYVSDGVINSNQAPDPYTFGTFPPLVLGLSACAGTTPAAGHATISEVCITEP